MCYDPAAVAAYAGSSRRVPTGPPRTTSGRSIVAQTGTRVRRLAELKYGPARTAQILGLHEGDVRDFLARLQPLRRARRDPARLVRPRSQVEAENARQARLRAAVAFKARLRRIARREARRQTRREAEAAWGPRGEASERAEWSEARARLEALKAPPPADVARQVVGELAAIATSPIESAPVNTWVGPTSPWASGSAHGGSKLTEADVIEARRLRAEGWSTGKLAKKFGCARNTICYALNGKTWRDCQDPRQDPPSPAP